MFKTGKSNLFPQKGLILFAFILSGLYWFYLAFTSQMIISSDAIGYENLGHMLYKNGWIEYFRSGPNREALYPLVISWAMRTADLLNVPYQSIQKPLQVLILFITQLLTLNILNKLNINRYLKSACLLYIGFSPALVNSAFSLYSEIATYPLILSIILLTAQTWPTLREASVSRTVRHALAIAVLFIGIISVKALFIYLLPLFLLPFVILAVRGSASKNKRILTNSLSFVIVLYLFVSLFVCTVQTLNKKHNGHYTFTDRGKSTFSIAAFLRTQGITQENLDHALRAHPHLEFSQQGENIWTGKRSRLMDRGVALERLDTETFKIALRQITQHPFSYFFFYFLQAMKIFFWESMRIGFVAYPDWMTGIFQYDPLENFLYVFSGILTFSAILYSLKFIKGHMDILLSAQHKQDNATFLLSSILMILMPFTFLNGLVIVLPRFILPVVPCYVILIAFLLQKTLKIKP